MTRQRNSNIGIPSAFALFLAVLTVLTVFAGSATAQNPVPFIDQPLVPDATAPGGAGFTLTVNGAGFVAASVVHWNGSPRATTFVSSSRLTAAILASDTATASTASVTVVNPSPGGVSNTLYFSTVVPGASVSFLPAATYGSGGSWYASVAVADVNGDGKLDLIVANEGGGSNGDGSVGVLLGNGDGTFQPAVSYDSVSGYMSVAVADVNGDGKPDLVVGGSCPGVVGGCVGVLLGNGDGTFKPVVFYSSGDGPGQPWSIPLPIVVVDVNGDGKPDVLVANPCAANNASCSEGSVGVLLGNGDGTFQPAVTYASGGYFAGGLAVADLNGDGKPDLVVTNCEATGSDSCIGTGAGNGVVGVLLGNGDGTFQAVKTYNSGTPEWLWTQVVVADLKGDGKLDVLIANEGGHDGNGEGSAGVLLGNGDGTLQPVATYASGGDWAISIAVADLNADGKPDLVLANFSGSMGVLLGNGDGTFQPAQSYPAGTANHSISVLVTDVNGDGIQDALVMTWGPVEVLLGNGDGTFQEAQSYGPGAGGFIGDPGPVLAIGDLGNDGRTDLVVANNREVGVLLNNAEPGSPTTTALASSRNPSTFGQAVTFTAAVSSASGTPSGTVIFSDASTSTTLGSATLASGSAAISVSSLAAGSHSITAAYQGSANFSASTSVPVSQIVSIAATTTSIASSLNPAGTNQTVTFTATVTSQYGGAATGSVTFYSGTQTLGTATLSGNRATLTTSFATAGTYSISAKYNGDGNNAGSTSSTLSQVIIAATTTTLVSSLNPSLVGQAVTFTATVSSTAGTPPNGETVTFYNGSAVLGTAPLSGGIASLTTSSLPVGTFTITATYPGDTNFAASTSPGLRQVVNSTTKSATSTALASSLNPSIYGQRVTWTATVTTSGSVTPTGKVNFKWGGNSIGTATLNASGVATLSKSNLNVYTYPLTAVYSGDANNTGSTSPILNQVVKETTSAAKISSSPNPSTQGQAVTFTATITSPTVTATGPVTFTAGKTVLGTAQLSGHKATFTTSTLPVGSTTVTATYNGDSNIAESSASVTQTVQQ
jgi:hypothetical protein